MTARYRCKQTVEAMQWRDTDAMREAFAAWFDDNDVAFETRGPIVVLPDAGGIIEAIESDWIVLSGGEFSVVYDVNFRDEYEAA